MKDGSFSRIITAAAYAGFTVLTALITIRAGFAPVALALGASALVFVVGVITGEADILYLAWLDQGSNLLFVEAESSSATVLIVTATVIGVLLMADLAHIVELFGRHGFAGSVRSLLAQFSRLLLVGAVSGFLAVVCIAFSPVLTAPSDQVLFVSLLAIGTLAAIAVVGLADR